MGRAQRKSTVHELCTAHSARRRKKKRGGVANEGARHPQASRWDVAHCRYHVVGDPLHEVGAVLVLDVQYLLVHFLHGHASTEYGSNGEVGREREREREGEREGGRERERERGRETNKPLASFSPRPLAVRWVESTVNLLGQTTQVTKERERERERDNVSTCHESCHWNPPHFGSTSTRVVYQLYVYVTVT